MVTLVRLHNLTDVNSGPEEDADSKHVEVAVDGQNAEVRIAPRPCDSRAEITLPDTRGVKHAPCRL